MITADTAKCEQRAGQRGDGGVATPWRESRAVLVAAVVMANWTVLRWFVARLGDGGDEAWGLVALGLALVLTPRQVWRSRLPSFAAMWALGFGMIAALSVGVVPVLVRALLMIAAIGIALGGGPGALGRAGLMALSLPVVATLQFFAGYPLRIITAEAGRPLIALFGVATERTGVALTWAGGQVVVDAPCSGVHMLWTGGVLACGLAAWLRLSVWRTVLFGLFAFICIVVGNIVRAAILFFIESGLWSAPSWAHEGAGLAVFAILAVLVIAVANRLAKGPRSEKLPIAEKAGSVAIFLEEKHPEKIRHTMVSRWVTVAVVGFCLLGTIWPVVRARANQAGAPAEQTAVVWPEMFDGKPWIHVRDSVRVGAFAAGFSGEVGVFRQGERIVVLRWIKEASRGVHPAADCFRASGYTVKPGGLVRDAQGVAWAVFTAERGGEYLRVRERWYGEGGGEWTDVSAWYWAATGGRGGPWWAVTVVEEDF